MKQSQAKFDKILIEVTTLNNKLKELKEKSNGIISSKKGNIGSIKLCQF